MRRETADAARGLERTLRERAAPVGLPRYYALLFAPAEVRPALTALYAFDAEIRAAVHPGTEHAAAHLKLTWWREEIERLARGKPVHPIGRALHAAAEPLGLEITGLADYLVAAEHDLSARSIVDDDEFMGYLQRGGGLLQQLAASFAQPSLDRRSDTRRFGGSLGRGLRLVEILRGVRSHATAGRVRLPESRLQACNVSATELAADTLSPKTLALLSACATQAQALITDALDLRMVDRPRQRAGIVLGTLALATLKRMRSGGFTPQSSTADGGLSQLWRAWRAARGA